MTRTARAATVDSADQPAGRAATRPELQAWLDATCEFVRAVNRDVPLDDLLSLIAGTVAQLTTYDYCSVLLPDEAGEKLLIRGRSTPPGPRSSARANGPRGPPAGPSAPSGR